MDNKFCIFAETELPSISYATVKHDKVKQEQFKDTLKTVFKMETGHTRSSQSEFGFIVFQSKNRSNNSVLTLRATSLILQKRKNNCTKKVRTLQKHITHYNKTLQKRHCTVRHMREWDKWEYVENDVDWICPELFCFVQNYASNNPRYIDILEVSTS